MLSAILPAHNEEETIAPIVATLRKTPLVKEVIIVDDGSEDETGKRAAQAGAKVIRLAKNRGKGEALKVGVQEAKGDFLLFLDADLIGLKREHIELLIRPVVSGHLEVTVGWLDRGKSLNRFFQKFESPFSGLRALKRNFWEEIPEEFKHGYFIESALTYFTKEKKLRSQSFVLVGLKHRLKEQKRGFWLGISQRLKMLGEIALANFLLRL